MPAVNFLNKKDRKMKCTPKVRHFWGAYQTRSFINHFISLPFLTLSQGLSDLFYMG